VITIHQRYRQTDRRTDRRTTYHGNTSLRYASRGKKLSTSIKIHVVKRYGVCLVSFQIVDRIRRQSSCASSELCSHRRRRRDKTVSSRRRRRCVLGIMKRSPRLSVCLCRLSVPRQISKITRHGKSRSDSKNLTSDFAPEVIKYLQIKHPQFGDFDN